MAVHATANTPAFSGSSAGSAPLTAADCNTERQLHLAEVTDESSGSSATAVLDSKAASESLHDEQRTDIPAEAAMNDAGIPAGLDPVRTSSGKVRVGQCQVHFIASMPQHVEVGLS